MKKMKKKKEYIYYLSDYSRPNIYKLGFRYSPYAECYFYIFPVIKYKNKPTIFCRLKLKRVDNNIQYDIIKANGEPLSIYYNRTYGRAENYIRRIDKIVRREMYKMGIHRKKVNNIDKEKIDD